MLPYQLYFTINLLNRNLKNVSEMTNPIDNLVTLRDTCHSHIFPTKFSSNINRRIRIDNKVTWLT